MTIQDILKKYREKANMTQEQVAQALYVQRSAYTHYENGTRKVDADTFFKLMDIFGLQLSIKEKKQFQWRLDYEEHGDATEKEPIILVFYEWKDRYRMDGFLWDGNEKKDLVFSGSSDLEQGIWFEWEDVNGILSYEWKGRYKVVDMEFITFDELVLPSFEERTKERRFSETLSITQIEWWVKKTVKERFGHTINYTFQMEPNDDYGSGLLGEDEETQQSVYEVFKMTHPKRMKELEEEVKEYKKKLLNYTLDELEEQCKEMNCHNLEYTPNNNASALEEHRKKTLRNTLLSCYERTCIAEELDDFQHDANENFTDAVLGSLLGGKILSYRMDKHHYDKITINCKA